MVQNKTERLDGLGVGGASGKMPILWSFGKFDNNHIFFLDPGEIYNRFLYVRMLFRRYLSNLAEKCSPDNEP